MAFLGQRGCIDVPPAIALGNGDVRGHRGSVVTGVGVACHDSHGVGWTARCLYSYYHRDAQHVLVHHVPTYASNLFVSPYI